MTNHSDHPNVATHPPLIFLVFLVSALVLGWVVPLPNPWLFALRWTGGFAILAGLILGAAAITQMIKARTSPDPHEATTALVTSGPYRFSRNPIYLGFLHIYLGVTLMAGTLWGVIIAPLLVISLNRLIIQAEESYLAGKFGESYLAYKSRVRRWL